MPGHVIKLNQSSWQILRGELIVKMPRSAAVSLLAKSSVECDLTLFQELKDKRSKLARERKIPAYIIFSDRTLRDMARYYPQSSEMMIRISVVGEHKLKEYGTEFLDLLKGYCQQHQLKERDPVTSVAPEPRNSRSTEICLTIIAEGSFQAAMVRCDLKLETMLKHVQTSLESGDQIPPDLILAQSSLSETEQNLIIRSFEELGLDRLAPVYQAHNEDISYLELRIIQTYLTGLKNRFTEYRLLREWHKGQITR
ncbi:MAG: HRDC domain-containing protein [Candidatus Cloacimonetes bacterium]|nr:HRDC domain-containing protein [Candidatus Cloacimonadota bacterium]